MLATQVKSYYMRPDISINLGGMRNVYKEWSVKLFLQNTIQETYNKFQADNTEADNISQSQFAKFRPSNVKLAGSMPLNQSMCEKCANADLAIKSLRKNVPESIRAEYGLTSKYALIEKTLCAKQDVFFLWQSVLWKRVCWLWSGPNPHQAKGLGILWYTAWTDWLHEMAAS